MNTLSILLELVSFLMKVLALSVAIFTVFIFIGFATRGKEGETMPDYENPQL